MKDKIEVDRARYEALERFAEAFGRYRLKAYPPTGLDIHYAAIPPKPEELIEMEGWTAKVDSSGPTCCWARWDGRRGAVAITGPDCFTEQEAIRAGNAMLLEIANKVLNTGVEP